MKIIQNQKFFKRNLAQLINELADPSENSAANLAGGRLIDFADDKSAQNKSSGGLVFKNVEFMNCDIGLDNDLANPQTISGVNFIGCTFRSCFFGPCVLRDVLLENTCFNNYGILDSVLFCRVKIKGKITSFRINKCGFMTHKNPKLQRKIDAFRQDFYSRADWALDISEARLSSFDYDGIPARLFVLDTSTQFVVRRDKFHSLNQLSEEFESKFSYVTAYLKDFLEDGREDIVLTVPTSRPKKFRKPIADGLNELRALGLAE